MEVLMLVLMLVKVLMMMLMTLIMHKLRCTQTRRNSIRVRLKEATVQFMAKEFRTWVKQKGKVVKFYVP